MSTKFRSFWIVANCGKFISVILSEHKIWQCSISAKKLLVRLDDITINFKFLLSKVAPFVRWESKFLMCAIFETNEQQAYPGSADWFVSFGVHASTWKQYFPESSCFLVNNERNISLKIPLCSGILLRCGSASGEDLAEHFTCTHADCDLNPFTLQKKSARQGWKSAKIIFVFGKARVKCAV